MNTSRLIFFTLFVFAAGTVQSLGIPLFGINPNIVFVLLILIAMKEERAIVFLSSAVALFVLKSSPALDFQTFFTAGFPIAVYYLRDNLPWEEELNTFIFLILGITSFYLIADPGLIKSSLFVGELVIDLAMGAAFFALFRWAWQNKPIRY